MPTQKNSFLQAMLFPLLFMLIAWMIFFYDNRYHLNLYQFGNSPRTLNGLIGIFTMPLLHGDIHHILSNTLPFLILSTLLFYYYHEIALKVFAAIYFFSGILVWLMADIIDNDTARAHFHIGASGVIYGLAGFLFISGIIRKHKALFGISLLVTFLYGTIIWGIFPESFQKAMHIIREKEHISWEGHLFGFVSGTVMAFVYRKRGIQAPVYSWDINNDEDVDESNPYWMVDENGEPLKKPDSTENDILKNTSDNPYTVHYHFIPKKDERGNQVD